ncbi:ABC transporter substrate-binding protein [Herbaspirillum sp. YR522]|uniref:ABC transporter substrate-binding protein n=1 Tax=Herbaspirillum sp. YR522 TaxID=1144342 RepID=UPI00026FB409|nr:extracellular solute-binding protein [Herbaspirillum sp. YR522]EJM95877.1 ABC-type sugar transport system, periplasmic component [Herbaspirillum sp. YR522]
MTSPTARKTPIAAEHVATARRCDGRRRRLLALGLAAAGTAWLSGCERGQPDETAAGTTPGTGATVLTALIWAPDWAEEMQRVADAFSREHPQIQVALQFMIGNSVEENLKPKAATNSLPDIVSVNPNPYGATLADQGLLSDMGQCAAWGNLPEALQADWISPDHRHFGIPTGIATTLIYYNIDLFERAGIGALPTDFDAFIATGLALKQAGLTPLALSGGFPNMLANGPFSHGFANNIVAGIPDWRARIANGTLPLDSPAGAGIFARLRQLVDHDLLQPDFMQAGYDDTLRLFADGRAAMTFQGSWAAGSLMRARNQRVGVFAPPWNDRGQAPVPVIGSETGFAIAQRGSEQSRQAARQFIDYLYGRGMPIWQSKRQNIPPLRKLGEEVAGDRALFALVERLAQQGTGPGLYYSYLPTNTIERLHGLLQAVLFGKMAPADAAHLLHDSISEQARSDNK